MPTDIKPVSKWLDRDEAWVDVVEGILRAIATLLAPPPPSLPPVIPNSMPPPQEPLAIHGMELLLIPAGDFLMGDEDQDDNPRRTVYLDAFSILKYPVTVQQYMAFVKATGHSEPEKPSWGWKDDHPIVNVSWEDAQAYCVWLSALVGRKMTLPTEAQWEKAARGTDGLRYPWGDNWDSKGSARVLRGGSWLNANVDYFRCAFRLRSTPVGRSNYDGFRCASLADFR